MPEFSRSELLGADPVLILTIDYAGRTFLFSTQPVEISDADGVSFPYAGGLPEYTWDDAIELFSDEPELRTASFSLVFPVDIAELIARGHDFGAATAELALHLPGDAWEDRKRLIVGSLSQPEYGAAGEAVSFSVEEQPWDDSTFIIPSSARVDKETWSTAPIGENPNALIYYPLVFGTAGVYNDADGSSTFTSGAKAPIVDPLTGAASTVLVAGHRVEATQCRIYPKDGSGGSFNLSTTTDDLGRTVTTADISGASTAFKTAGEFWSIWNSGNALIDPETGAGITGAGALLRYLLNKSSLRVDSGRVAAAVQTLNQFKVSGYIDDPEATCWEWIKDNLIPILPVTVRVGGDGVYPVVWRWDARAEDAVESITVGPGISRIGRVQYTRTPDDVRNSFRLEYALRVRNGAYQRIALLDATRAANSGTYATNAHVLVSQARFGVRATAASTDIVYDQETAHRINAWQSIAYGFLHRVVEYSVPISYGWLFPGAVVLLTDDELHISNQICLVNNVRWGGVGLVLSFLIIEDIARDALKYGA